MNWKLIIQLSLFGLIMAFGTISLIPEKIEFVFWLVIFAICAYILAKVGTGRYFIHGFFISIFNSIWITAAHIIFYGSYVAHHPDMADMSANMSMKDHPIGLMIIMGPLFGVMFGIVQGLFAFVASKLVTPREEV